MGMNDICDYCKDKVFFSLFLNELSSISWVNASLTCAESARVLSRLCFQRITSFTTSPSPWRCSWMRWIGKGKGSASGVAEVSVCDSQQPCALLLFLAVLQVPRMIVNIVQILPMRTLREVQKPTPGCLLQRWGPHLSLWRSMQSLVFRNSSY